MIKMAPKIFDELANICTNNTGKNEKLYACKYKWIHLPTGKKGNGIFQTNSELEFAKEINKWNAQQPGRWLYYYGGK